MAFEWQRFKRSIALISGMGAAAIALGCSSGGADNSATSVGKPLVVASYSVLCDITSQIAEDTVELDCLIDYDQDPHTYEGTPSDRRAIEQADLILYAGMNFEPSIIQMVSASSNPSAQIAVHDQSVQNLIEYNADGQPVPDPHIWHDVNNGLRMVETIHDALTTLSPENSGVYAENSEDLQAQLRELDAWIVEQIQTIPEAQRQLVTTHDAMSYYSRAYGLTVAGTLLGLSPEEEPTAARVSELVTSVREIGVPTLFAELTTNDRVLRTVAAEAGVQISDNVLIADGVGAQGTPEGSYQGMLVYNTCTIVEGLGGECELGP
ncbi:MAG: zinc ABC transporter substrate-binding protein [Synechococcus sp.]